MSTSSSFTLQRRNLTREAIKVGRMKTVVADCASKWKGKRDFRSGSSPLDGCQVHTTMQPWTDRCRCFLAAKRTDGARKTRRCCLAPQHLDRVLRNSPNSARFLRTRNLYSDSSSVPIGEIARTQPLTCEFAELLHICFQKSQQCGRV